MKKPAPLTEKPQKHGHPAYAELEISNLYKNRTLFDRVHFLI